jgi:hypothetical protein
MVALASDDCRAFFGCPALRSRVKGGKLPERIVALLRLSELHSAEKKITPLHKNAME